ncbi:MAG: nucleotidyltransferase family protein [Anaerolineales bacterium]|nr:nucleotidyltransferase family protein [Anaerolineales bacterium]
MTLTNVEIQELYDKILPVLRPYQVERIAVFGSVVRGEMTPDSDLDILVTLKPPGQRPPIGLKWFDLIDELSRILQRPVDLVTDDGLSPHIRPYVEQEMVVLYEEE